MVMDNSPLVVFPPIRGISTFEASENNPFENSFKKSSLASGSVSDNVKQYGFAPMAAKSDKFTSKDL